VNQQTDRQGKFMRDCLLKWKEHSLRLARHYRQRFSSKGQFNLHTQDKEMLTYRR